MAEKYDIAVLGGGPGGYVAAIRASQLGYKTVVVDKDNMGGICLNWGCIPTKALLKTAELYEKIKHADQFGIAVENCTFDFAKVIKRSREVADRLSKNIEFLMKKNSITRIKGFGRLVSASKLEIMGNDREKNDEIEFERLIIATGARPRQLPQIPVDGKKIITSSEAMTLKELPGEMIIIGAGAIGIEFAYFYSVLGTKVTVVEMMDTILPVEDKEVSEALMKELKKKGINILISSMVESATVQDGRVEVVISRGNKTEKYSADIVLNAIGVTGNIEGIGLEELGIETFKNHIKADKATYATTVSNIYAIGDVIGPPWLAHVASAEGIHCIESIKGLNPPAIDYDTIPGCTYCQPQVASVGLTEQKAKERGYELKIGKFPFTASGKAFAAGERQGFVKVIFDAKYGEFLGAHIIGSEATEMIAELTLAKSMEGTFESIIRTVHAHPTLSESNMEAAANAYGEAIHI